MIFAQDTVPMNGIYALGTEHSYKFLKAEPVYWVNRANEFNVYVDSKSQLLLTLKDNTCPDLKELPLFERVFVSDYSFMLCTEDKKGYYFTTKGYEQNQTLDLVKNFGYEIVNVFYGSDFTEQKVNNISLEKLKVAKSIHDVIGNK